MGQVRPSPGNIDDPGRSGRFAADPDCPPEPPGPSDKRLEFKIFPAPAVAGPDRALKPDVTWRLPLLAACLAAPLWIAACGSSDTGALVGGPLGSGSGGGGKPGAHALPTSGTGGSGGGSGGGTGGGASTGPTPEQAFNALEPALYASCGSCHGVSTGLAAAPKWLLGPNRYKTVTSYPGIVVTDVESSLLLTIGDTVQHAGGPGISDAPPAHLLDAVTAWLEMEAAAVQAVPLAATSPFTIQNGTTTIDISKGGVPGASMTFTALIQGTIITFTDMTITAPTASGLEIVHPIFAVILPGDDPVGDVGDSFSNLDQTVPAGQTQPLGVGLFVLDVAATAGKPWATGDQLEVEFTTLAKVSASDAGADSGGGSGGCKDLADYVADAVPAIQANTCLTCHQGQNAEATSNLDMTMVGTNNAAACAQALTKVDLTNPTQSEIILAPTGGIASHPFKGASASFKTMMLEWIDKE
jgi:hypothetical protein